jgi:hypothetical protein
MLHPAPSDWISTAAAKRKKLKRKAMPMAHERACSTIPKVVAFASRSFISPFTVFSGLRPTQ